MVKIEELKFNENGLIPAVVIDAKTGKLLTLAYMNEESLKITMEEKRTCFFSRSRNELWRKGETSGNIQHVKSIVADCDRDALAVYVEKEGPACHLGNESCFEFPVFDAGDGSAGEACSDGAASEACSYGAAGETCVDGASDFDLENLYALLKSRKSEMPEGSYTTYLFEKGMDKILKKVGEESTEVIIAGKGGDRGEAVYEIADLAYHVMVMMVEMGISVEDIKSELKSRHIIDKKVKQEKMV